MVFVSPYLYYSANPGPMLAFVYAGATLFTFSYVWFCVGETTGLSNTDIDLLFMDGVPVRIWRPYAFADEVEQSLEKEEKENIVQKVEQVKV